VIARPIAEVCEYLSKAENLPVWVLGVDEAVQSRMGLYRTESEAGLGVPPRELLNPPAVVTPSKRWLSKVQQPIRNQSWQGPSALVRVVAAAAW
jgi:hypothetical protein